MVGDCGLVGDQLRAWGRGQLILNGSHDIAFTMDLALKDLGFAMGFGREFGVPLDLAGMTQQTFVKGRAAYGGGHSRLRS